MGDEPAARRRIERTPAPHLEAAARRRADRVDPAGCQRGLVHRAVEVDRVGQRRVRWCAGRASLPVEPADHAGDVPAGRQHDLVGVGRQHGDPRMVDGDRAGGGRGQIRGQPVGGRERVRAVRQVEHQHPVHGGVRRAGRLAGQRIAVLGHVGPKIGQCQQGHLGLAGEVAQRGPVFRRTRRVAVRALAELGRCGADRDRGQGFGNVEGDQAQAGRGGRQRRPVRDLGRSPTGWASTAHIGAMARRVTRTARRDAQAPGEVA